MVIRWADVAFMTTEEIKQELVKIAARVNVQQNTRRALMLRPPIQIGGRMGRKGRKSGLRWEDAIERDNEWIKARGKATVFQVPENAKVTWRRGNKIRGFMQGSTFVDFAGYQHGTAKFVGFDAKSTKAKTSWQFPDEDDKQRIWLADVARQGGAAFFYLFRREVGERRLGTRRYILPVDEDGVVAGTTGRKSVNFDRIEADGYMLEADEDWHDACVRLEILEAI